MTKKNVEVSRSTMSSEELARLTVDQLLTLKLSDEEKEHLKTINQNRETLRQQRSELAAIEGNELTRELRNAGLAVNSVWDLVNTSKPYSQAIPILLMHLERPYFDVIKDGIARALAINHPLVSEHWPLLVEEYCKAQEGVGEIVKGHSEILPLKSKEGLACALAANVSDETLPEFLSLIKDPGNGKSRVILLTAFKGKKNKFKSIPVVQELLCSLQDDEYLKLMIADLKT